MAKDWHKIDLKLTQNWYNGNSNGRIVIVMVELSIFECIFDTAFTDLRLILSQQMLFTKSDKKIASKIFKNGTLTKCPLDLDVDNCLKWITGERNASLLRDWQCVWVTHAAIESKPRLMWPLVTIVQPDLMEKFTLMAEGFLPQYYRLTKCLPSGTAVSQAGCVRSIQKTKHNQANDQDDLYRKVHSHQISHVPTSFCISSSSLPLEPINISYCT